MKHPRLLLLMAILCLSPLMAFASDKSDAEDLMNKCDANAKNAVSSVRNFGDTNELASYEKGLATIKQGKIKLLQSKFLEAKAKFEEYLKSEYELYASLSPKYLERTQTLIDKIAEDLVDYAAKPEVLKVFTEAAQSLNEAKIAFNAKKYEAVIQNCRVAKSRILNCYAVVKLEMPADYKKDLADCTGKIFEK